MGEAGETYQLTITRHVPNPKYDPKRESLPHYGSPEPLTYETQALSMMVSQEQFDAIRKAALMVF